MRNALHSGDPSPNVLDRLARAIDIAEATGRVVARIDVSFIAALGEQLDATIRSFDFAVDRAAMSGGSRDELEACCRRLGDLIGFAGLVARTARDCAFTPTGRLRTSRASRRNLRPELRDWPSAEIARRNRTLAPSRRRRDDRAAASRDLLAAPDAPALSAAEDA